MKLLFVGIFILIFTSCEAQDFDTSGYIKSTFMTYIQTEDGYYDVLKVNAKNYIEIYQSPLTKSLIYVKLLSNKRIFALKKNFTTDLKLEDYFARNVNIFYRLSFQKRMTSKKWRYYTNQLTDR